MRQRYRAGTGKPQAPTPPAYPTASQFVTHGLPPGDLSGERTNKNTQAVSYLPVGGSGPARPAIPDDFNRAHVAAFNAVYMQQRVVMSEYQDLSYPVSSRDLLVPPVIGPNNKYLLANQSPTSIDPRLYRLRTFTQIQQPTTSTHQGDFID